MGCNSINGLHLLPLQRMDQYDESQFDRGIVHLVVGDDAGSKSQVVDFVSNFFNASLSKTTPAGVRVFTTSCSGNTIVDTTPLHVPEQSGLSFFEKQQVARQWISQNSLRRLLVGKLLSVLCVVTNSVDCEISCEAYRKNLAWLEVLSSMFQEQKSSLKMLVNTHHIDETDLPSAKQHIETVLGQHKFEVGNTKYLNWSSRQGEDLLPQFFLEDIVREGQVQLEKSIIGEGEQIKDGTCLPRCPWDPERVILFGRTGSGKSTLAQMLTRAKLESNSGVFPSSSGLRGQTKKVSCAQGRGWYVVDTPGFGEPAQKQSTVPTQVAEDRIKKFVSQIDGLFTHFLFVVKKDRIDQLEIRLWRFFCCLFGDDINEHFSIVITNADEKWVSTNRKDLENSFRGCGSFLCADFPSSETYEDEELEEELQEIRMESLQQMENELAKLSRTDIVCDFGDLSKTAVLNAKLRYQGRGLRNLHYNASILALRLCSAMACLKQTLTIDEDIALLPF